MPLLRLETTVALDDQKLKSLMADLSRLVAEILGKPEEYVMVTVNPAAILMSGKPGDAAFIEVRSIGGLSADKNQQLSQKICRVLNHSLSVPTNRIYLNFTDVEAANWGWNESTFA